MYLLVCFTGSVVRCSGVECYVVEWSGVQRGVPYDHLSVSMTISLSSIWFDHFFYFHRII